MVGWKYARLYIIVPDMKSEAELIRTCGLFKDASTSAKEKCSKASSAMGRSLASRALSIAFSLWDRHLVSSIVPGKMKKEISPHTNVKIPSIMRIQDQPARPLVPSSLTIPYASKPEKPPAKDAEEKNKAIRSWYRNMIDIIQLQETFRLQPDQGKIERQSTPNSF